MSNSSDLSSESISSLDVSSDSEGYDNITVLTLDTVDGLINSLETNPSSHGLRNYATFVEKLCTNISTTSLKVLIDPATKLRIALYAAELVPRVLANFSLLGAKTAIMRQLFSSTMKLAKEADDLSPDDAKILSLLLVMVSRLVPLTTVMCERSSYQSFLRSIFKTVVSLFLSQQCVSAISNDITGFSTGVSQHPGDVLKNGGKWVVDAFPSPKSFEASGDKNKLSDGALALTLPLAAITAIKSIVGSASAATLPNKVRMLKQLNMRLLMRFGRPKPYTSKIVRFFHDATIDMYVSTGPETLEAFSAAFCRQAISHLHYVNSGKGHPLFVTSKAYKKHETKKKAGDKAASSSDDRDLVSWGFISGLDMQLTAIAFTQLRSMYYPWIEISLHYLRILPCTLRFMPVRLRVLSYLSTLQSRTNCFIPLGLVCLETLVEAIKPHSDVGSSENVGKWRGKLETGPNMLLDLSFLTVAPKDLAASLLYKKTLVHDLCRLLLEIHAPFVTDVTYPEISLKCRLHLSRIIKAMHGECCLPGFGYTIKYSHAMVPFSREAITKLSAIRKVLITMADEIVEIRDSGDSPLYLGSFLQAEEKWRAVFAERCSKVSDTVASFRSLMDEYSSTEHMRVSTDNQDDTLGSKLLTSTVSAKNTRPAEAIKERFDLGDSNLFEAENGEEDVLEEIQLSDE